MPDPAVSSSPFQTEPIARFDFAESVRAEIERESNLQRLRPIPQRGQKRPRPTPVPAPTSEDDFAELDPLDLEPLDDADSGALFMAAAAVALLAGMGSVVTLLSAVTLAGVLLA